jgi:hypothetical protein
MGGCESGDHAWIASVNLQCPGHPDGVRIFQPRVAI